MNIRAVILFADLAAIGPVASLTAGLLQANAGLVVQTVCSDAFALLTEATPASTVLAVVSNTRSPVAFTT